MVEAAQGVKVQSGAANRPPDVPPRRQATLKKRGEVAIALALKEFT